MSESKAKAEEALDWISGTANSSEWSGIIDEMPNAIGLVRAYISELESQVPRWISLDERWPDRDQEVLFINKYGSMHVSARIGYAKDRVEWGEAGSIGLDEGIITHWMLLPDPTKPEKEEG